MDNRDNRDDVKEKLVEASIRLFLRKGYAGTAVNEIASSAGVSKGGLYWYFKSKEAVVEAILDRYRDQFIEEITKKVNGCSGDFATKFRAFYKFTTEFARDNRELLLVFTALLIEFAGTGTELEKRMKEVHNSYTFIIQRLLEEGIRKGDVGIEIDPVIYARFFSSALVGSQLQWYLGNWAYYENDPAYDRRHALIQRDALLKVVLSKESSATSGSIKVKPRGWRHTRT
jgi:AcrR family transcriptional regulator